MKIPPVLYGVVAELGMLKAAFAVEKAAQAYCKNGDVVQIVGVPIEEISLFDGDGSPLPLGLWITPDSSTPFIVKPDGAKKHYKTRRGQRYMRVSLPRFPAF